MTMRSLLVFALLFFTNTANVFSQQQVRTAADFELTGVAETAKRKL
ncbi:MAG: hypothetical protein LC794_06195 [Acidobacteria bacterium]|nr:hypothetical protein [Acidobacteriota bacterium]